MTTRAALIGLGAIGTELIRILARSGSEVTVTGALVAHPDKHAGAACPVFGDLDALIATRPDVVVECARHGALVAHGAQVLARGCDLMVASVGALADDSLLAACTAAAKKSGAQILVPAGALAGIDAVVSARHVGIDRVIYRRKAPPSTWIRSGAITEAEAARHTGAFLVYAGSARTAALKYPKNANVTATLALAGLGFDRTEVELMADPAVSGSTHAIWAQGAFGEMNCEIATRAISPATTVSSIVVGSLARGIVSRDACIAI